MSAIRYLLRICVYVVSIVLFGTTFASHYAFAAPYEIHEENIFFHGGKVEFFYTDGTKIPEAEVKQLIHEGMIPDSASAFYIFATADDSSSAYFDSQNYVISRMFDYIENGKSEDDVEYKDIVGGFSDISISANSPDGFFTFFAGLSFSDDIENQKEKFSFYSELGKVYALHGGSADIPRVFVPHKLFIPDGYPELTVRGDAYEEYEDEERSLILHVFEVEYRGEKPTVPLQVKKTWQGFDDDEIPSFIDVVLVDADGNEVAKTQITKESEWVSSFENLPTYKDGEKIDYSTYSVKEITRFDNVSTSVNYSADDGFTITNAKTNTPPTDTPDKPQDPKTPETPKEPEKLVKEIPKTGDSIPVKAILSMLPLSLTCMALVRYARRCER